MKAKKISIAFIFIYLGSYLFFGDSLMEHKVFSNFKEFEKQRLLNKYNVKGVKEAYYFASCGDDFFRDTKFLNEFVIGLKNKDLLKGDADYPEINVFESNYGVVEKLTTETKKSEDKNCIIFNTCVLFEVPFLYKKIAQDELFSTHTDFHAMLYNNQANHYEIQYVWGVFKWFEIKKTKS